MSPAPKVDLTAIARLDGVVMRLVEQQGAQATRRITDSLEEQAWLEDFLETSKPDLPDAEECPVRHRLLLTPFRYPKRYGSRFSRPWEWGLFYGSRSRLGCLLEGAFDELVFQAGPERPFPRSAAMRKTLFHVNVRTERGLQCNSNAPKPCSDACVILSIRVCPKPRGSGCAKPESKLSSTTLPAALTMWCSSVRSAAACFRAPPLIRWMCRWKAIPATWPCDAWMTTACGTSSGDSLR